MNITTNTESNMIEPIMGALRHLSPVSQGTVAALVKQLAESEGVSVEPTDAPAISGNGRERALRIGFPAAFTRPLLSSYGLEAESRSIRLEGVEGGGLELRETSPWSPIPGLPGPARLKVSRNFPMSPWSYFQLLQ